ncbi:EamA-like transporter family protein [Roseivivax jejudonensis]|uniref:EamA-like transporter family protein n=1 Tax=Roseivivax jejudonensis TaxID=1529041 RepID=A0A1X6YRJ7_9RHOB|nr:DMT family transporter [Roseivivax jejudonensis]SLN28520.1 EamA-like transporter family protein [Roseivivax jejudonensis]
MHRTRNLSGSVLDGVGLRLLAVFLLTAMSAAVREASQTVPVGQIVFVRSALALLPILLWLRWRHGLRAGLTTERPAAHLLRGLLGAVSITLSFISLAALPVTSAKALSYLAPVLSVPLAAMVLRERVGAAALVALAVALAGTAAMLHGALVLPGPGAAIGIAAGLGFALTMAVVRVLVRDMTRTEAPAAIAASMAAISALCALLSLPFGWVMPEGGAWVSLLATGLLGGFAAIAGTEAIARAPVAALAPVEYSGLVWALLFDVLLFATLPDRWALAGAGLILVAALIVTLRGAR